MLWPNFHVPTEYLCYCFDELSDPNAFHFSVFTWCTYHCITIYLYVTRLNEAMKFMANCIYDVFNHKLFKIVPILNEGPGA